MDGMQKVSRFLRQGVERPRPERNSRSATLDGPGNARLLPQSAAQFHPI